jgi:hypothetical protein
MEIQLYPHEQKQFSELLPGIVETLTDISAPVNTGSYPLPIMPSIADGRVTIVDTQEDANADIINILLVNGMAPLAVYLASRLPHNRDYLADLIDNSMREER